MLYPGRFRADAMSLQPVSEIELRLAKERSRMGVDLT